MVVLGGPIQDAEISAGVPKTVPNHRRGPHILPPLLRLVQRGPSSRRHRPDGARPDPLRAGQRNPRRPPNRPRRGVPSLTGALRPPAPQTAPNPDCRLDQPAQENRASPSLNSKTYCLKVVDTFRPACRAEPYRRPAKPSGLWFSAMGQSTRRLLMRGGRR